MNEDFNQLFISFSIYKTKQKIKYRPQSSFESKALTGRTTEDPKNPRKYSKQANYSKMTDG